jgi:hypothetical protein
MRIYKYRVGSNQHKKVHKSNADKYLVALGIGVYAFAILGFSVPKVLHETNESFLRQFEFGQFPPVAFAVETKIAGTSAELQTIDEKVDFYANKFGKTAWTKLRTKTLLHYFLLRESAYGNTKVCGDNGLACGPLQFHEATYQGFRKIMIKRGLTTEVGSRLDMDNAIETAAWAINDGRENDWGPYARGEIKA